MFLDCLSESTLKHVYVGLVDIYGFFDYSKELIYQHLQRYCTERKIQFNSSCIPHLVNKNIILSDNKFRPIEDIVSGIYISSLSSKEDGYINFQDIKNLLKKHENHNITILIMKH